MAVCVLRLFFAVPWVGLNYVIVVFPGHTHFLFTQKVSPADVVIRIPNDDKFICNLQKQLHDDTLH